MPKVESQGSSWILDENTKPQDDCMCYWDWYRKWWLNWDQTDGWSQVLIVETELYNVKIRFP